MAEDVVCPGCGTRNRVPAAAAGVPRCPKCKSSLPWVVDAVPGHFDEVSSAPLPVLVDLWAPWCGPCRLVSPAVEAAGRELAGRLKVVKVNVDDSPEVAARYEVQGIPTLLMLRGGQVVARQVGALSSTALRAWLQTQLAAASAAG